MFTVTATPLTLECQLSTIDLYMADIVKLGRRGEFILPRHVRAALGLREGDELLVSLDEEAIVLKRKARRFGQYLETLRRPQGDRERT